jgi:hypothetical protein
VALVAVLLGACSGGSSEPPTTPPSTPPPATTAIIATTVELTPSAVTTVLPFSGGINGPVSPGSTEPASR